MGRVGKQVHVDIISEGFDSILSTGNACATFYAKHKRIDHTFHGKTRCSFMHCHDCKVCWKWNKWGFLKVTLRFLLRYFDIIKQQLKEEEQNKGYSSHSKAARGWYWYA